MYGFLLIMIAIQASRGPGGDRESVVGLTVCQPLSWLLFALFSLLAVLFTYIAARIVDREYKQKLEVGYNFTRGDVTLTAAGMTRLVATSFVGAFVAGLAGVGPGIVFQTYFVVVDMHPSVASGSANILTTFVTLSATINLIIDKRLNIPYTLAINFVTLLASIPGLRLQDWQIRASGRNQFTILIMLFFAVLTLVTFLPLSLRDTLLAYEEGEDITSFNSYCS
jgi:uncharacterized membrane protein YfcA